MEHFNKILKKVGFSSIVVSLIFAILGLVLIMKPEGTVKFISYIIGTMFILVGIVRIMTYVFSKNKYDFYNYDMLFGIISILIGIVAIIYTDTIGTIFRIIVGIWIIYSGLTRIDLSIKLKELNSIVWTYSLGLSVTMLLGGIYILVNSGAIVITIGVLMLVYAIIDIIESVFFMKNVNKI